MAAERRALVPHTVLLSFLCFVIDLLFCFCLKDCFFFFFVSLCSNDDSVLIVLMLFLLEHVPLFFVLFHSLALIFFTLIICFTCTYHDLQRGITVRYTHQLEGRVVMKTNVNFTAVFY